MIKDIQLWIPAITITLPVLIAIFVAIWSQTKHFDTMNARLSSLERRMDRLEGQMGEVMLILRDIQSTLKDLDRRVTALEQRSSPIVRE